MAAYIYAHDATDYTTMGLVGELMPTKCEHEEVAGGLSQLTIEHPIDKLGRWAALTEGAVVKVPVPVRTVPPIVGGRVVTDLLTAVVKATASKAERTIYSKAVKGKKQKVLPVGLVVTAVAAAEERYSVRAGKFGSGWVAKEALEVTGQTQTPEDSGAIELVEPAWTEREQLFRIYEVAPMETEKAKQVVARALHISSDLMGNMTTYDTQETVTPQAALDALLAGCVDEHDFKAYTDIDDPLLGAPYARYNPIKALMDKESGLIKRTGGQLVRDNYQLYLLSKAGINRGVRIEYAKNLLGLEAQRSIEGLITAVLPVGENKDGQKIYLGPNPDVPATEITEASFIHSSRAGAYAAPHIYVLDVPEARIDSKKGGTNVTPALACERLRQAALDLLATGVDLPLVSLTVDFLRLGDTVEYQRYKRLDDVYLYDQVMVRHPGLGVEQRLDVVRVVYDCIRQKYVKIELGALRDLMATNVMATWQMPNGIDGGKILGQTIGTGHIIAESITAELIRAYTIQAVHIAAKAITAEKMVADFLITQDFVAQLAKIWVASIDKADIGEVHIDYADIVDMRAKWADLASAEIGKASIGWAQIRDLDTHRAVFQAGVGDRLLIDRLAVSEANMVSLTTGELIVKGSDGRFYAITVDAETGKIEPVLKQIVGGDVKDGSIDASAKLIEQSITAKLLNAAQIFGDAAFFRVITAANMKLGTLTVGHMTADFGATLDISGNRALRSIISRDLVRQMIADSTRELRISYDGAGTHLVGDDDTTTMTAKVYEAGIEITGTIPEAAFRWARASGDPEADAAWAAARAGMRQITVTKADVVGRSIISCTLLSTGDLAVRIRIDMETLRPVITLPEFGDDWAGYDPATGLLAVRGEGYGYDQATQAITVDKNLSATRTTVQYTFSDETGLRTLIRQTEDSIMLGVENQLAAQSAVLSVSLGEISAQVADKASTSYVDQKANSISQTVSSLSGRVTKIEQTDASVAVRLKNPDVNQDLEVAIGTDPTASFRTGLSFLLNDNNNGGVYPYGANALVVTARGNLMLTSGAYAGGSLQLVERSGAPFISVYGHFCPGETGQHTLGQATERWDQLFVVKANNVSSDLRLKRDIKPLHVPDLLRRLKPIRYRLRADPESLHFGFGYQHVKKAIEGTDYEDAALVSDKDPEGLGVCYEEFHAVHVEGWQEHDRRLARVERAQKYDAHLLEYYERAFGIQGRAIRLMQREIKDLKGENADLKSRLARLEQLLGVQ